MTTNKLSRLNFIRQSVMASVFFLMSGVLFPSCTNGQENNAKKHTFNGSYSGRNLDYIAFPIGGLGAGMFCMEGSGAISNMSVRHSPELLHEPMMFAAIYLKGVENGAKVIEGPSPLWKRFGMPGSQTSSGYTTWGLPRFKEASFQARFPFADIALKDDKLPVSVALKGWSPFIPSDEDNSSLPVGAIEYTLHNKSNKEVEGIFSYNSNHFLRDNGGVYTVKPLSRGFILSQAGSEDKPFLQSDFAIYTDDPQTKVNHCWFRGGWFDPLSIAWNDVAEGIIKENAAVESGAAGASLYVPFKLAAGASRTIRLYFSWYVPLSNLRRGSDEISEADQPDTSSCCAGEDKTCCTYDLTNAYRPWYSSKFKNIEEVVSCWRTNYDDLKSGTLSFTDAFYASTLPAEVLEAVSANLSIIKSTTVLRQYDGRLWGWEGSGSGGELTNHVWNYAQAIPHLFPALERTLRETEFYINQNKDGHQGVWSSLPVRPLRHNTQAAADGQLGGIMKAYREWRISGNTEWIGTMYPNIRQSMEYCIKTWDPKETGALEEPHFNTYDIWFWGPNGMCTSFYAGALQAITLIGKTLGKDVTRYETLLAKSKSYLETKLYDGEYFIQDIRWKDLQAPAPTGGSVEEVALREQEGPTYQYGKGCLSDGVLGSWISRVCGMQDAIDRTKVKSHLLAVHKYNFRTDLRNHANPQRPGYAMGDDGGLLLCSWPKGGKPQLPFVYSNEVWTGIEYQVASHLMFEGEVEKGLEIVRTCRKRYDGHIRNPFNEYEWGAWYTRAMSSYGLLEGLTGVRYDAVEGTLYIDSRIGNNFTTFLSTGTGFGNVGLKGGKPFVNVVHGKIDVKKCLVSGTEKKVN